MGPRRLPGPRAQELDGSFLSLWCPFSTAAKTMTKVVDTWTTVREKGNLGEDGAREGKMDDDKSPILLCVFFLYMSCGRERTITGRMALHAQFF